MCGIIGYTGYEQAEKKITTGLEILEYRGYDSVGACLLKNGKHEITKVKGRINDLKARLSLGENEQAFTGIGHTRWATHGSPSDENAHPHKVGRVTLVHNGIIENYESIKAGLIKEGITFFSDTDSEVACALINKYYNESTHPCVAILKALREIRGSYAFAIMFEGYEGEIFALRYSSPLLVAKDKNGSYLASDITAFLPFTKEYATIHEGEIAHLTKDEIKIYSHDGTFEPQWQTTNLDYASAKKGGYEHFMLKEIYEQPDVVNECVLKRVKDFLPDFSYDKIDSEIFEGIKNIHIVACGSAMHAGMLGARLIEELSGVSASAFIASEYRYSPPLFHSPTLVIAISQSGETMDTLSALRYAKGSGCKILAIVNTHSSSIAREADKAIYTEAGPEIAVATTKGYISQLAILYLIACYLGLIRGRVNSSQCQEYIKDILDASNDMKKALERTSELRAFAEKIKDSEHLYYIGRGIDYSLCMEASLKLKEISYIHSEAYPAGELKHGTISLIENNTPVFAICTDERLYDKTKSNIKEVKARGANTFILCFLGAREPQKSAEHVFVLNGRSKISRLLNGVLACQIIAYETARLRGCEIDRPRNLAKSVTVE